MPKPKKTPEAEKPEAWAKRVGQVPVGLTLTAVERQGLRELAAKAGLSSSESCRRLVRWALANGANTLEILAKTT